MKKSLFLLLLLAGFRLMDSIIIIAGKLRLVSKRKQKRKKGKPLYLASGQPAFIFFQQLIRFQTHDKIHNHIATATL